MGFKEKTNIVTQQMMSDHDLEIFRESEKDLRDKITSAKATLDKLNSQIEDAGTNLKSLSTQCVDAQSSLNDFRETLQSERDQLTKEAAAIVKDDQAAVETARQKNKKDAADNQALAATLKDQKQAQETAQSQLDAAIEQMTSDQDTFRKKCEEREQYFGEQAQKLKDLVAQDQALLDEIKKENEATNKKLNDAKDQLAKLGDVQKTLAENQAVLDEVQKLNDAIKTERARLQTWEDNLKDSAKAQDNTKNQIQIQLDLIASEKADLEIRQKAVTDAESKLKKGA